ncbi:MAG: class I SAM-dependent methyltransferase [Gemmataceae bacterium]
MTHYRNDLAFIHDAGFGHVAANAAVELLQLLQARGVSSGLVVDLACGSGILAEKVSGAGYDVLGVDLSQEMLALARRRAPKASFRQGSLLSVEIPPCVAVSMVGECLNYLFDPGNSTAARRRLWRRIHQALAPGGLLLCDVAGPGRLGAPAKQLAFEGDGWVVLVWAEEDEKRRILTRRMTTFRKAGELYRRDAEVHRLRLIDPGAVARELRGAGFRVRRLRAYGAWALGQGHAGFLARRETSTRGNPA